MFCSYYEEGAPEHQLMNDNRIIDLYHGVECIIFEYLQNQKDKKSNCLNK